MGQRTAGLTQKYQQIVPWPRGWYSAAVVEKYSIKDGALTFTTQDRSIPSDKDPSRHNLQICLAAVCADMEPQIKYVNHNEYYSADSYFDDDRLAELKAMSAKYKNGAWPNGMARNEAITAGKLGSIEDALLGGADFQKSDDGGIDISMIMGRECEVMLSIFRSKEGTKFPEEVPKDILDDYFTTGEGWTKGWYYDVKHWAAPGTHTNKLPKTKAAI